MSVGFTMNTFYECCVEEEEKGRMEALEPFDEFEEWHLKCNHYCITAGLQGIYHCLPQWRGETRAETARQEKMRSARAW